MSNHYYIDIACVLGILGRFQTKTYICEATLVQDYIYIKITDDTCSVLMEWLGSNRAMGATFISPFSSPVASTPSDIVSIEYREALWVNVCVWTYMYVVCVWVGVGGGGGGGWSR